MKTLMISCTLAISLFSSTSSAGCECNPSKSIKEEIESSKFIFKGTPIFADTIGVMLTFGTNDTIKTAMARITFIVERVFKGSFSSDTVQVITGIGGGDCGFPFVTGKEYFVFCNSIIVGEFKIHYGEYLSSDHSKVTRKEYLTTNICTWTGQYRKEFEPEIIAELKN